MPKTAPFDRYSSNYEDWFERFAHVHQAELRAIQHLVDPGWIGVEIGVGSGRFAESLGIEIGIEPSEAMAAIARKRKINTIKATAESLPFKDNSFDYALMVTTICFVDDPLAALSEALRVVRPKGHLILGFVDADSPLGRQYQENKDKSLFYKQARFFSAEELIDLLCEVGFSRIRSMQTIFTSLEKTGPDEDVIEGYGKGSFVALRAQKDI